MEPPGSNRGDPNTGRGNSKPRGLRLMRVRFPPPAPTLTRPPALQIEASARDVLGAPRDHISEKIPPPGTIIMQNTRLHHTVDSPPWPSATTRPYLSLHRLSESSARVPILETPRHACAHLEARRVRRSANTRDKRFAQPRWSSPSSSDASEVLRNTVRFPPLPPPR